LIEYKYAVFGDLWKYDIQSKKWGWISGSDEPNFAGNYTNKNEPCNGLPGLFFLFKIESFDQNIGNFFIHIIAARERAIVWTHTPTNHFYIFGGGIGGSNFLNDLWRWDGNCWTWLSGNHIYIPFLPIIYLQTISSI
jgi:hypothetical protein